jgi:hypothetical protein
MYPIQSITITGSAAQPYFSNIPQTFTHLQVRIFGRAAGAVTGTRSGVQFNSDGGANYGYGYHYIDTNATTAITGNGGSTGYPVIYNASLPGTTTTSQVNGCVIIDIYDYTNTNKYKVVRSYGGYDANTTTGSSSVTSGLWLNTAAINSITMASANTPYTLSVGTRIDLYGISSSSIGTL